MLARYSEKRSTYLTLDVLDALDASFAQHSTLDTRTLLPRSNQSTTEACASHASRAARAKTSLQIIIPSYTDLDVRLLCACLAFHMLVIPPHRPQTSFHYIDSSLHRARGLKLQLVHISAVCTCVGEFRGHADYGGGRGISGRLRPNKERERDLLRGFVVFSFSGVVLVGAASLVGSLASLYFDL